MPLKEALFDSWKRILSFLEFGADDGKPEVFRPSRLVGSIR